MLRKVGNDATYKRMMASGYDNRAELLSLAIFGVSEKATKLSGVRTYMQMIGDDLMNLVFGDDRSHKMPKLAYIFETIFEGKMHRLEIFDACEETKMILLVDKNQVEIANKDKVLTKFKDIVK